MIEQTIAQSIVEEPEHVDFGQIDERVMRGVRYLDLKQPDWADKINLDTFKIVDVHQCVLGQVYGNYLDVVKNWWGTEADYEAHELGFFDHNGDGYEDLQRDWVKVIKERQRLQPVA